MLYPSEIQAYTLSHSIKEACNVKEDAISEVLMLDHSVTIKHFVGRIWEVLSTKLIKFAKLISS